MTGKTARSCDSCARRPAKWYCTADDAFLCCGCDASVHAVNPLARRHRRLQLRDDNNPRNDDDSCPAWLRGFTRKARTPRPHNKTTTPSVVPEIETSDENNNDESGEDASTYRVPVFGPEPVEALVGFLPSNKELEEFNDGIESLLAPGVDNGPFSIEVLYALEEDNPLMKEEFDDTLGGHGNTETYEDINLEEADECHMQSKKVGLRLDYEAIISEWSVQGSSSPWMDGERPQLGPDNCWLDYMGMWGGDQVPGQAHAEVGGGHADEGREARVSRYRKKRRTRLFAKKIRYEVRKLNAEKRPRMKGRFVKRTAFAAAAPIAPALSC